VIQEPTKVEEVLQGMKLHKEGRKAGPTTANQPKAGKTKQGKKQ
jgi:hypothetical protein